MKDITKPEITTILSSEDEILFVVSIENDIMQVLESLSTKGNAHKLNSALLSVGELETSDRTKKDALYELMTSDYHDGFEYFLT